MSRKHKRGRWAGTILFIGMFTLAATINWLYTEPPTDIVIHHPGGGQIIAAEPSPSPTPTVAGVSVDDIVDKIWALESGRGTNGGPGSLQYYCEQRGGWNELGWGGMKGVNGVKICFKNKEEGFARVIRRINDLYEKYDGNLATTLCMYNQGKTLKTCQYYQDYLDLVEKE